ncbi:hypothetical protein [Flavobacterium sp.]|uniref:hypothetical protein n=1 Tax=Flavobacterium sp. TaxID=239 RepID=UPI0025BEFDE4|nr:hypothetical protein [Flavobacterium sp.]
MKNILNYLPYIVVLLAQFFINNYNIIVILTILTGLVAAFKIENKRVFLKSFLVGLVAFTIVFLIYESRVEYVKDLLVNIGLPGLFIYVLFPLFSALNTAILFFIGYKTGRLVLEKKLARTSQA